MDITVTLTFRTIIPFERDDIDVSEVTELDAYDQLLDTTRADLLDNWTLIATNTTTWTPPEE